MRLDLFLIFQLPKHKGGIKMMSKVLRVAIYIRVSHDEQVRHGLSLEAQHKSLTEYAKKHGYKIVDYYIDEGLTARKTLRKRVNFNRMIEDVKADKIDLIIFIKLDRWFRNVADYYKTMEILEAHNCKWKCTEEDYDLETSTGRLNLNIRLSMAQNESDQTSDRINYVFESRRKEGYVTSGACPFGYKIENKRYVIHEENAEILKKIFSYFVTSGSLSETLEWYRNTYNTLSYDSLKRYLKNTAYIGKYVTDSGELIENYTPAIIDKNLFNQAQILLQKNIKITKREKHSPNLIFGGLVYCNVCKSKFSRRIIKNKGIEYCYYGCHRVSHKNCNNGRGINEKKLELYMLDHIKIEATKYIGENKIKGTKTNINKPIDNTTKIKSKMRKLRELYLEDDIDKLEYDERKIKLQKELDDNITELNKIEKPKDLSELEKLINSDFETLYHSLTNQNKRKFWASFIDKIYIEEGQVINIIFL